ncbi:MAG: xanthine dehydrogenase family protein molybdopterin-binding subunit [Deltaproteobacteria bacterium]|nr:xanthine dehydrogenase family protein molybdopterin-binding subunit [Deltaproteobacteria bacterium]
MKFNSINIGSILCRPDALLKVSGEAKFAVDYYENNCVWAGVKRALEPHAILKNIDCVNALKIPGVLKVLTHKDVQGTNRQGVIRKDQPVLVNDKIRHCGDAVALVLAETKSDLSLAIDAVQIEMERLPAVTDIATALETDSHLVHEHNEKSNILLAGDITVGKGLAAANQCDVLVEAKFETQRQEHAYMETENGWAWLDDEGRINIVCSTQTPFRDRVEIAEALGIDPKNIRIIVPYVGGAFGGKDGITVQSLLALAAQHSEGRPVKMWWNREESFLSSVKRHPSMMSYRLGAKLDGTLHFLDVDISLDTGPYDHLGGVVLALAMEHSGGPYRIPNGLIRGKCVYTNNPVGGAFRGFGVTQVTSAMERAVDLLAEKLGMDRLELRLQNALKAGDRNFIGKTLITSTGIIECLETLSRHKLWRRKLSWKCGAPIFKKRGIGISAVMHASGYGPVVPDYANAKLELTENGKFRIYCGVVDMGQGNTTANIQIIGSLLNQPVGRIEVILPDTDKTLPSGSASASRCTYTFGNALVSAAGIMRERLCQKVADLLMIKDSNEFSMVPEAIRHLPTNREIRLETIARTMDLAEKVVIAHFRAPVATDLVTNDQEMRLHGIPHNLFSYSANLAYIEIDEITGKVGVQKYLTVSDCGKVVNPQLYDQQIQGGICQGLGLALYENFETLDGYVLTKDLSTYLVPTSMDVPDVESVALGIHEPSGPFGSKGIGEISTNGPLPTIANAIFDATGHMLKKSPIKPEAVLAALERNLSR